MHTKLKIKEQLKAMGIKPDDAILIHTSYRSIGEVEGGIDGLRRRIFVRYIHSRKTILKNVIDVECIDTAIAAKMLAKGQYGEDYAVICRKNAGELFGLHLLAENIEDDKSNKTLFGLFKLK